MRKFRRSPRGDEWLGGVCSGLAYSFGVPVWMTRLGIFLLIWAAGTGVLMYILLCLFVPKWGHGEPRDYYEVTDD